MTTDWDIFLMTLPGLIGTNIHPKMVNFRSNLLFQTERYMRMGKDGLNKKRL